MALPPPYECPCQKQIRNTNKPEKITQATANGMSYYSQHQYAQNYEYDSFHYSLFFEKGQRILDIGCSTGNFLAQDPKRIIGLDSDADAVAIARKRGLRALRHDITKKLPFKAASLDNVHCN